MKVIKRYEDGPILIEPDVFRDDRGYFFESFNEEEFKEKVADVTFVQDNQSKSSFGTIRGMHYQKGEHAQAKLVRVINGAVIDVVVDIRPDSKTYLKTFSAYLSERNHRQFFVPRGFAHGFIAIEPNTIFQYKCDNYYDKESEGSFIFSDTPDFDWEYYVAKELWLISEKDNTAPRLKDVDFSSFLGLANEKSVLELDLDEVKEAMGGMFVNKVLDRESYLNWLNGSYVEYLDGTVGLIFGSTKYTVIESPVPQVILNVRNNETGEIEYINLGDLKKIRRIYRKVNDGH